GRPIIDSGYNASPGVIGYEWEGSRRLIMDKVYDARVASVDRVQRILTRDPALGLPDVDQVTVWVDHVGLFDGEYRVFVNADVHREWLLQRANGNPWKISSVQHL